MYYPRRTLILTALTAMLSGILLHFLFSHWPNSVTALFSPVNESLWEHVKLLFWPYLLSALWLNRDRPGGLRPWAFTLLLLCALLLLLGYLYHVPLGGRTLWVDIALYLILMALGFWLPTRFSGPFHSLPWLLAPCLVLLLGGFILFFTFFPPDQILFTQLAAGYWLTLPC